MQQNCIQKKSLEQELKVVETLTSDYELFILYLTGALWLNIEISLMPRET
jgi:hypothetical protein